MRFALAALGLTSALLVAGSPGASAADVLANGGFEEGTGGWSANAGQLEAVAAPVHTGEFAGRFIGNNQPAIQSVYQWVSVQPNADYELSGWIGASGEGLKLVFLQVSWYDTTGQLLYKWDSDWLPQFDGTFYRLTTGQHLSLSAARQARVTVVVQSDSPFTVHLDDLVLAGPPTLPSTPTPAPIPTPDPTPAVTPSPGPPQSNSNSSTGTIPDTFAALNRTGGGSRSNSGVPGTACIPKSHKWRLRAASRGRNSIRLA